MWISPRQLLEQDEFDDAQCTREVLQRALSSDPEDRFGTVTEFVQDLIIGLHQDELIVSDQFAMGLEAENGTIEISREDILLHLAGGPLTAEEARYHLFDLRSEIWGEYSNGRPDPQGVLRKRMLDSFIKHKITSRDDMERWIERYDLDKTDKAQFEYLSKIFDIVKRIRP